MVTAWGSRTLAARKAPTMYVPSHFAETRTDVLHQLVRDHPLAVLVTRDGGADRRGHPDAGRRCGRAVDQFISGGTTGARFGSGRQRGDEIRGALVVSGGTASELRRAANTPASIMASTWYARQHELW